jgi:outer membrane immunogenic protein
MRKLFLLGMSAVMLGGAAQAADMKAPPPPAPVFSWTGFYIGGHWGWGWGDTDARVLEADNNFFPQGTINGNEFDGLLLGGQVGVNYQAGQWVLGIEGQISKSGIEGKHNRHDAILLPNRYSDTSTHVDWVATLTGRLGFAAGRTLLADNTLFYVKGGAAWADFGSVTNSFVSSTGLLLQTISGGETRSGWTVGAGVEWAFGVNWSAKAEYNFIDLGTERVTRSGTNFVSGDPVVRFRDADTQLHVVKLGINYRFAPAAAPVAARY